MESYHSRLQPSVNCATDLLSRVWWNMAVCVVPMVLPNRPSLRLLVSLPGSGGGGGDRGSGLGGGRVCGRGGVKKGCSIIEVC